jgi:hypothetical protein
MRGRGSNEILVAKLINPKIFRERSRHSGKSAVRMLNYVGINSG